MIFRRPLTLGEHAMATIIAALLAITTYVALLYAFEEKITCTQKLCEGSSGPSRTPASTPFTTPKGTGATSDAWTSEELTSTEQHAASWIPPLAAETPG